MLCLVAPLDLPTDAFFPARRNAIETRLLEIQQGKIVSLLNRHYESNFGVDCVGVDWESYLLPMLQTIVGCIGSAALALVCRMFAEDYKNCGAGLPDLFLWRSDLHGSLEEGGIGRCRLVEVKGPNDRLSDKQRVWADALMNAGLEVEICKVSTDAASGRKQTKKAKNK